MGDFIFGHVQGYPVGSVFTDRKELSRTRIHPPPQTGISGNRKTGANSIVLSGGYEDDADYGDEIIFTGQGGRDPKTGKQVKNQILDRGNLGLAVSQTKGFPVRVIRGAQNKSIYSPKTGFRYDGLYRVEDHWQETGKSGFFVWRFRLVKIDDSEGAYQPPKKVEEEKNGESEMSPKRAEVTILRVIRDTKQARFVKEMYDYKCQVCGTRLVGNAGPYAEAAHIRPLGKPHNGPDEPGNILCLCPNHHTLFDLGGFSIGEDLIILGIEASLFVHTKHKIEKEFIRYRREHYPLVD